MSGLALYLKSTGNYVQGSDISNFGTKAKLEKKGIKVFSFHSKKNINDIDVVVYNFAIKLDNEELKEAKKRV